MKNKKVAKPLSSKQKRCQKQEMDQDIERMDKYLERNKERFRKALLLSQTNFIKKSG